MLKIKTDSNNQIDIENKSIEVSDRVSADGAVTISAKTPTEIKIIKATAAKAIVTDKGEIPISTEDAKSVRKVIGILRAPFAKSVKQNGGNGAGTETSDEFTYTKTPGTISKLFIHFYDGCNTEYIDSNKPTTLGGTIENVTINDTVITDVYVDKDGVPRFDVNVVTAASGKKYISGERIKDNYNEFNVVTVLDVDITGQSYISDIGNAMKTPESLNKFMLSLVKDAREHNVVYDFNDIEDYSGVTGSFRIDKDTADVNTVGILINNVLSDRSHGDGLAEEVQVIGSDKLLSNYYRVLALPVGDNYSSHCITTVIEDHSGDTDFSSGFKGLRIIEKALEQGRALDLAVDVGHNCSRHSID